MFRRTALAFVLSAVALAALPGFARAQTGEDPAAAFVNQFAQKGIVDVLDAQIPQTEKTERFRTLFKQFFDIPAIARFTTGRFWRAAKPEEQTEFMAAFEDVIVYTWSRRFSEYNGQTLKILSTSPDGENGALVSSTLVGKDQDPVGVTWRLRKRPEGWRVVDVTVQGSFSMATTYRDEYASILAREGGFPGLIKQLRTQAANLKSQQ